MWMKQEGFVITSAHEPLSFMRRSGRDNIHSDENYAKLHTEDTVLKLKEMGLNLFRFHFHKGCGYEMEREDRERTREFSKLCHKHGMKIQLYVQFGTLMPETYRMEEPDYDSWLMRHEDGRPITLLYSHQTFRNHPCPNQPCYWEHLKKIVKEAVIDCEADAIGFDNVSWAEEPEVCHCPACKRAFTDFLKQRYPTEAGRMARFGHGSLDYITPPVWNYYNNHFNLTEIQQPVMQEWMEFRALSLKRRVDEMYAECKRLNPDVFVEINAFRQTGQNTTFITGLYVSDISTGCDGFWSEMEPEAGFADGILHHKIRAYKSARALDKLLFTGHGWGDDKPESLKQYQLAMSESLVFQYGSINGIRLLQDYLPIKNQNLPHMPLLRFSKAHRDMYLAEPLPFVHVYESRASLSNSNFESHYANILMQQVLLREKIPYAILHSLGHLDDCQTILLPGVMCLSEKEIQGLTDFVYNGGGLVLTGNTGDFDETYRSWSDRSLKARLGILKQASGGMITVGGGLWPVVVEKGGYCAAGFGKGKVAAFPRLSAHHDFGSYNWTPNAFAQSQIWVKPESWEAPEDIRRIGDAIRWTLHYSLPVEINAPEPLLCELAGNGKTRYLHLLNYDTACPARAITATFQDNILSAELMMPLTGETRALEVLAGNSVVVEEVEIYAVIQAALA